MSRRRPAHKHLGSGDDQVTDKRAELLKSEIDLGFTFVAVALTSYAAGKLEEARQGAKAAQKKFDAAQKQLVNIEIRRDQRQVATDRLKNLEQVLATIELRDPGIFATLSTETARRK